MSNETCYHFIIIIMAGRYRKGESAAPTRTVRPPSLFDAYGPARPRTDFGPLEKKDRLSVQAQVELIRMSQVGLVTTQVFQLLVLGLWCMATMVPGFVLFDGTAGVISAFTHAGWWLFIEIVVLFVGAMAVYFGIFYNDGTYNIQFKGRIDKSGVATLQWLNSYRWLCVMSTVSHGTHFILTWFEFGDKSSTLYRSYYWCFISLLALLFIDMALAAWQVSRAAVYYSNLYYMLNNGANDGAMALFMTTTGTTHDEDDDVPPPAPQAPVVVEPEVAETDAASAIPMQSRSIGTAHAYRHGYRMTGNGK